MGTIYHLTPADYYESLDPDSDYLPAAFDQDGFIHCSADEEQMLEVANRFYKGEPGEFLLLAIDEDAVRADVRHEDAAPEPDGNLYPHIYGPLNRDAIREVRPFSRAPDGTFHW
jgi:uncharacterized protein (DUF952 family)